MRPERKSNRLQGYDYSKSGLYFVTSCVYEKVNDFGEIINSKMLLNQYGEIAQQQWFWLAQQYPYIKLHAFIVMPNHIHGIIEIKRSLAVRTGRDLSVPGAAPKIKPLSQIIGAYKTTTSKLIRQAGLTEFAWHRSFHDHIIQDEEAFIKISDYIETNPALWEKDKFYK
ncbi:MAG: hypothetical protein EOP53_09060 [Sphingobacteriales bacterium]|nr:MAG: hypothetical protein EOP53_09060 [Sphingobacteriales bacterium]